MAGLMSASSILTRSRDNLLHHSAVSSTPSIFMMSYCWSHFSSSFNIFFREQATCLRGIWYGLLFGLTCNGKVLSKHLILLHTYVKSFYNCCVISVLILLSILWLGSGRIYFILLFLLSITNYFSLLSVF